MRRRVSRAASMHKSPRCQARVQAPNRPAHTTGVLSAHPATATKKPAAPNRCKLAACRLGGMMSPSAAAEAVCKSWCRSVELALPPSHCQSVGSNSTSDLGR